VRAAAQVPQGRGPLREEDRGGVRGQAVRHLVRYLGSPRDHSESIAVAGLVEDQGFLEQLKELLSDSNPMVVANAVAALSEINESSPTGQPLVGNAIIGASPLRRHPSLFPNLSRAEPRHHQQAADRPERVHRVGPGLHPGLALQLQSEGRARGAEHLRAHNAAPGPRQRRRRPVGGQGPDEDDGDPRRRHRVLRHPQQEAGPAVGHPPLVRTGSAIRGPPQYQPDRPEEAGHPQARDEGVLRQVQRPHLRQAREAGHHDPAGVASQYCASAERAEGVRHGGGRGLRAEGGQGHWEVRHQGGTVGGEVRLDAAGPDPDQGQLRRPGGDRRHQRYLPQVPQQVREHHQHALRESGHAGRTRGQSQHGLDHRRVRGTHRQCRRAPRQLPGRLRRRKRSSPAPAPHRRRQALPQAAGAHPSTSPARPQLGHSRFGQSRLARPRLHLLETVEYRSSSRQRSGLGRQAFNLRRDGPSGTHSLGRVDLSHIFSGERVPQAADGVRRRTKRRDQEDTTGETRIS
jgi:hypothetical protein